MSSYRATICGLQRELPIVAVPHGTRIAFLDLYGDVELLDACAKEISARLEDEIDLIVAPETGGILLAHLVAASAGKPYVIVRKKIKPHMHSPLCTRVRSRTTGGEQVLFLGGKDIDRVRGRSVAVVDEVVSTGATMRAVQELVGLAGGEVSQILAVATEGEPRSDVVTLCHFPIFEDWG